MPLNRKVRTFYETDQIVLLKGFLIHTSSSCRAVLKYLHSIYPLSEPKDARIRLDARKAQSMAKVRPAIVR
jgi:hypothetical protein